jgi:hypothetical protein
MWSAGCIFAEWIQKRPMFPGSTVPEQVAKISAILGPPQLDWEEFKFLLYAETFVILSKLQHLTVGSLSLICIFLSLT